MPTDNSDFDAIFTEATAEVEAGGGIEATTAAKGGSKVYLGDGEVIDPQGVDDDSDESLELDEDATDDTDDDDGADDDVSDETNVDVPTVESFDWSEHKDELVTIKVNGEEITIPLGEALAGSMRQADYTRKTQEIAKLKTEADWGRDMKAALTADPQTVIRQMAEAFGVELSPEADPYADVDDDLKPFAQKLGVLERQNQQLEARLAAQAEQAQQDQVNAEVQQEYAAVVAEFPDFNADEILPFAVATGLNMRDAYLLHRSRNGVTVTPKTVMKPSKEDVIARKKKLNQQVAANAGRKAAPTAPSKDFDNFADMFQYDLDNSK